MNKLLQSYYAKRDKRIKELQKRTPYETPMTIEEICNVSYGNATHRMVDFYAPMGTFGNKLPLMVLLHDNPFDGDKKDCRPFALEMARRGVLVASLNYTRALDGQFDAFHAQLGDVFCFLDWLRVNAQALGLSLDGESADAITVTAIALCGVGTGGHLAATALNVSGNRRMQEYWASASLSDYLLSPLPLSGLVAIGAPLCPRARLDKPFWGVLGNDLFGKDYRAKKGMDYLDFDANLSVDCPPVMIVTSDKDRYLKDALSTSKRLEALSRTVNLLRYPKEEDKEHVLESGFPVLYPLWRTSREANDKIAAFVRVL